MNKIKPNSVNKNSNYSVHQRLKAAGHAIRSHSHDVEQLTPAVIPTTPRVRNTFGITRRRFVVGMGVLAVGCIALWPIATKFLPQSRDSRVRSAIGSSSGNNQSLSDEIASGRDADSVVARDQSIEKRELVVWKPETTSRLIAAVTMPREIPIPRTDSLKLRSGGSELTQVDFTQVATVSARTLGELFERRRVSVGITSSVSDSLDSFSFPKIRLQLTPPKP